MKAKDSIPDLKKRIRQLEKENALLKKKKEPFYTEKKMVKAPKNIQPVFDRASLSVKKYFQSFQVNPGSSKIQINWQGYILVRAESLSNDFLKNIIKIYADCLPETIRIGSNLLFDMANPTGPGSCFNSRQPINSPIKLYA